MKWAYRHTRAFRQTTSLLWRMHSLGAGERTDKEEKNPNETI